MQTVATWRALELSIESSRDCQNPSDAVDAEAIFIRPDGVKIRRSAILDGGRTPEGRFAPRVTGNWR